MLRLEQVTSTLLSDLYATHSERYVSSLRIIPCTYVPLKQNMSNCMFIRAHPTDAQHIEWAYDSDDGNYTYDDVTIAEFDQLFGGGLVVLQD